MGFNLGFKGLNSTYYLARLEFQFSVWDIEVLPISDYTHNSCVKIIRQITLGAVCVQLCISSLLTERAAAYKIRRFCYCENFWHRTQWWVWPLSLRDPAKPSYAIYRISHPQPKITYILKTERDGSAETSYSECPPHFCEIVTKKITRPHVWNEHNNTQYPGNTRYTTYCRNIDSLLRLTVRFYVLGSKE